MRVVRVGPLPESALEAAAEFHAGVMPSIPPLPSEEDIVIIFPPAPYDHCGWRRAVVQDLARAAAPGRVNAIVGEDEAAIAATLTYLDGAPGVTGQLLAV